MHLGILKGGTPVERQLTDWRLAADQDAARDPRELVASPTEQPALGTTGLGRATHGGRFQSWNLVAAWGVAVVAIWVAAALVGQYLPAARGGVSTPRSPVEVLSAWDGTHYAAIATEGYSTVGAAQRRFAFFPLLPALARLFGGPFSHVVLAGILIAQACLLGCVLLLGTLAHGGRPAPLRLQPGFWLLVSPLSFFFSAFYTESLFLFLTLLTVVRYRRAAFGTSFVSGFMAGVTRPTVLTLPVLFAWDAARRLRRGERWRGSLLCAMAPWVGLALYLGAVGYALGTPSGFFDVMERWWLQEWTLPFLPLLRDGQRLLLDLRHGGLPLADQAVRLFSSFSILGLLAWGWRRCDRAFLAYVVASMLLLHCREPHVSTARYELVLFPVFLLLPQTFLARPSVAPIAAGLLAAAQLYFLIRFGTWRWVA